MILADTSVWVAAMRPSPTVRISELERQEPVALCPPVYQEILQGFRDEGAYRVMASALSGYIMLEDPMTLELFQEAAQLYRAARKAGYTPRTSTDCLIAACAIRHNAEVLHRDRDYGFLARVSPLRQRAI